MSVTEVDPNILKPGMKVALKTKKEIRKEYNLSDKKELRIDNISIIAGMFTKYVYIHTVLPKHKYFTVKDDGINLHYPIGMIKTIVDTDWEVPPDTEARSKAKVEDEDIPWSDLTGEVVESKEVPTELLDVDIKEEMKCMFPMPILLEGPVGVGKSTLVMELAEELGLKYYASVLTDGTSKNEFTGYKNVMNGEYVSTEFRKCFEEGGLFNLEELNATTANLPIIFNTIENGYFVFADKIVKAHKDFRLVATMNEITNAKDFGGRRELDLSVKSRFHIIKMKKADDNRFQQSTLAYADTINDLLESSGVTLLVDPRDMSRFEHMCKNKNISKEVCLRKCMIKGKIEVYDDVLRKIIKEGNTW